MLSDENVAPLGKLDLGNAGHVGALRDDGRPSGLVELEDPVVWQGAMGVTGEDQPGERPRTGCGEDRSTYGGRTA